MSQQLRISRNSNFLSHPVSQVHHVFKSWWRWKPSPPTTPFCELSSISREMMQVFVGLACALPSCWRRQMGPVSPRTGMSNASPCHRCLLPAAQKKPTFQFLSRINEWKSNVHWRKRDDVLGRGSSAGTWSSRTVWCCRPSGCPARSAGPASSAAWSDSPAGRDGGNKNKRGFIWPKNNNKKKPLTDTKHEKEVGDSPLPAPDCESGTSPVGWRWWRAASPSDPAEAQRELRCQNLRRTQTHCCCHGLPPT